MRTFRMIIVLVAASILLFLIVQQSNAQPKPFPPPQFSFPWDIGLNNQIRWTAGPHGSLDPKYSGTYQGWNQVFALDFAHKSGYAFEVLAMQEGRVIDASGVTGCGPYGVRLDHGNYWQTEYCHLSSRRVSPGTWIAKGTILGNSGTRGCEQYKCGNHLHVSIMYGPERVYWDDKTIDGWKIHNIYDLQGRPLYGEGTATRGMNNPGWAYGTITDYFVSNKSAKFMVSMPEHTKVSSVTLKSTSGAYAPRTYYSSNNFLPSLNYRR